MSIVKLNSHTLPDQIRHLFHTPQSLSDFCSYYLTDSRAYHAFASLQNNRVESVISMCQSYEDPCWFITGCYNVFGNPYNVADTRDLISGAILYNEQQQLYKFFVTLPTNQETRRPTETLPVPVNYDYFDEMVVPKQGKVFFNKYWFALFNRTLPTEDVLVRCYYLKQEYRGLPMIGGST